MSVEDAGRRTEIGDQALAGWEPAAGQPPVLTEEEKLILDFLIVCRTARTVAQVSAGARVDRDQAVGALEGLRGKGLVTRFNTLVESYAARFPGLEV